MPDLLLSALYYATRMNWAVIPLHSIEDGRCTCPAKRCTSAGKHPRTEHGSADATTDRATIRDWWRTWPDANIGIVTGKINGLIVVDVDPRNGGDATFAELSEESKTPRTVVAETGGGGRHYFCKYTESNLNFKPGRGVDIKSDGGFVVAAPSVHESGNMYRWIKRPTPDVELKRLPKWAVAGPASSSRTGKGYDLILRNGERNNGLTSQCGKWRRTGMDEIVMYATAEAYNRQYCEPPLDEREVRSIVRSVCRYETPTEEITKQIAAQLDPDAPLPFNDLGNAHRLERLHGEDLKRTPGLGWLVWGGSRWEADTLANVRLRAYDVGRQVREDATERLGSDEKELHKALRHADYSESDRGINAMVRMVEPLPGIAEPVSTFDRDPWLFNVQNGTIDLRTGELRDHDRGDYITKLAPVFYNRRARAPRFMQFLRETFAEDADELIPYLQRLCGYFLTGVVTEQVFLVFWGKGGNGKTKLIEDAIGSVLGPDYMTMLSASVLLDKRFAGHPTELMDLRGARLAWASESGARKSLDEEVVKQLTGGDTIKARKMRADFEEFKPTHKLILLTNNKPRASTSDAIWRRLQLLPFEHKPAPDQIDRDLGDKLHDEADGILNWMLKGCLAWQKLGLAPPEKVLLATSQHREDEDIFGMFLAERCVFEPKARVSVNALYDEYSSWCIENTIRGMGKIRFGKELKSRDLGVERYTSNGVSRWKGVTIREK